MTTTTCLPTEKTVAQKAKRRGFTLTEIAIVLGIIGLILGAIWVAAAAVYNNLRVSRATTELLSIAQATRALFATSNVTGAVAADMTPNLIRAGVFPTDALDSGDPNTAVNVVAPWTGSRIKVYSVTSVGGVAGDAFQIAIGGVPPNACISLATSNTGAGRDSGLITVTGNAGAVNTNPAISPVAATVFPITVATAAGFCPIGAADNVYFTFKLKA